MSNEDYYKKLLQEDERLLREANEMLVKQDETIHGLLDELKEAQVHIEKLESLLYDDSPIDEESWH